MQSARVVCAVRAGGKRSQRPKRRSFRSLALETKSIAARIGVSWGYGKLNFNGKEYRFSVDGVTFVDFGVSKTSAAGEVYNLTDMADFEGNYIAAEANIALGRRGRGLPAQRKWRSQRLNSVAQGARLQLGSSGMKIKLW